RAGRPDCLIVDLHMPDLTGFDLQRHLTRAGIGIPTIIITAYNEPGLQERCQSAGAVAFLIKPLDGSKLVGAIKLATAPKLTLKGDGSEPPSPGVHSRG